MKKSVLWGLTLAIASCFTACNMSSNSGASSTLYYGFIGVYPKFADTAWDNHYADSVLTLYNRYTDSLSNPKYNDSLTAIEPAYTIANCLQDYIHPPVDRNPYYAPSCYNSLIQAKISVSVLSAFSSVTAYCQSFQDTTLWVADSSFAVSPDSGFVQLEPFGIVGGSMSEGCHFGKKYRILIANP